MSCELAPWMHDHPIADSIYKEYQILSGIRRFKKLSRGMGVIGKTQYLTIDDHVSEVVTGAIEFEPEPRNDDFDLDF